MTEYNEKNPNNEAISLYERNLAIEDKETDNSFLLFNNELATYYESKKPYNLKHTISYIYNNSDNNSSYIPHEVDKILTYSEAASLVNYLIKTYGEDNFFELYKDYSKLNDLYGKTFSELKEDWIKKLHSTIILN